MSNALALLVGLKSVDSTCYNGWTGENGCWGCELDVDNMGRILTPLGYDVRMLKTAEATRNSILASLYRASENTTGGDIFVFYYSGHGGQQPDISGDEVDGKDETLVAYDREVIDDKVHEALSRFDPGVCVVMISDSCNSGTNYRGRKTIPVDGDAIFRPIARNAKSAVEMKAQLIHLGGCRDGFGSTGYAGGGAFTMALCEGWQNGAFQGSFKDLHTKICELISTSQRPQYNEYGPVSDVFRNSRAFSVPSVTAGAGPVELPVMGGGATEAAISVPGEKDYYKFRATKDGKYTIETSGRTDLLMLLYGPDDETKLIAQDDDSGTRLNPKIVADLTVGTYYVRIQHYDSAGGTGEYTIAVSM